MILQWFTDWPYVDNGNISHEDARVGFSDVLARKQEGTKLKPTTISSLVLKELC